MLSQPLDVAIIFNASAGESPGAVKRTFLARK